MTRYLIGIDLGTTNSCVAYADTHHPRAPIQLLPLPQLTAPGNVESRALLPSYCYLSAEGEWPAGALRLPWGEERDYIVGAMALSHGVRVPTRLVEAAKSWLCHPAAARRDPILPPSGEPLRRISPVEATARYLAHIAAAWNGSVGKGDPFDEQEVIIAVPASFDEVARALTAEAAKRAGYGNVTLLEEPQAAFYCWIDGHGEGWRAQLKAGERILVCDIGGGTADFSLIDVVEGREKLAFERRAVGDHLLLGGDNIDATIAHFIAETRGWGDLSPSQWLQLTHEARKAKEILLGGENSSCRVTLAGAGASVVKGSFSAAITQQELIDLVLNGFFGLYPWQEALQRVPTRGMRTMGLPYEEEPSMTKQLACFLKSCGGSPPSHLLFNGGTLKPRLFQRAILDSLALWFGQPPQLLTSPHFDSAVARGAAYYGKVRRGIGEHIGGGSPRSYYLAISGSDKAEAMTLLARGTEENTSYTAPHLFSLTPNRPVSFDLYTSHTRLDDKPGDLIAIDPVELHKLPPIHTLLRYGKQGSQDPLPVALTISLTAIGTLELFLASELSHHRWKLEFQLRSATGQEDSLLTLGEGRRDVTYDTAHLTEALQLIEQWFDSKNAFDPKKLPEALEGALALPRRAWPPSALRALWEPLLKVAGERQLSTLREERWWNLAGWLLRPGYGYPLDDFRIKELWKLFLSEFKRHRADEVTLQQLICLRRVAGGLSRGQQAQACAETIALLLPSRGPLLPKQLQRQPELYSERLRTIASMEWLDLATKVRLGDALARRVGEGKAIAAELWSLARLATRHLAYSPLSCAISPSHCSQWLEILLASPHKKGNWSNAIGEMARLTGHREVDIPLELRQRLLASFGGEGRERLQGLLTAVLPLDIAEEERLFGEALPPGLSLLKEPIMEKRHAGELL